MTLNEAAARLGVTPATLRQQIARQKLRAVKRGRDWWVTEGEVARYLRESAGKPGRRIREHRDGCGPDTATYRCACLCHSRGVTRTR